MASSSPYQEYLQEHKLCGWLYKSSTSSPSRKLRWFQYSPSDGLLKYYSQPGDREELNHIDIATSTFQQGCSEYPGKNTIQTLHWLDIHSQKKVYRLYHQDQAVIDYWRSQLQLLRQSMINLAELALQESGESHWKILTGQNIIPCEIDEVTESMTSAQITSSEDMSSQSCTDDQTTKRMCSSEEETLNDPSTSSYSVFVDVDLARKSIGPATEHHHRPSLWKNMSFKNISAEAKNRFLHGSDANGSLTLRKSFNSKSLNRRPSSKWHQPLPTIDTSENNTYSSTTAVLSSSSQPAPMTSLTSSCDNLEQLSPAQTPTLNSFNATSMPHIPMTTSSPCLDDTHPNGTIPRFSITNLFNGMLSSFPGRSSISERRKTITENTNEESTRHQVRHDKSCEACARKDSLIQRQQEHIRTLESDFIAPSADQDNLTPEELKFRVKVLTEILASKDVLLQQAVEEKSISSLQNECERLRGSLAESLRNADLLIEENKRLFQMWSQWKLREKKITKVLMEMTTFYQTNLQSYKRRIAQYTATCEATTLATRGSVFQPSINVNSNITAVPDHDKTSASEDKGNLSTAETNSTLAVLETDVYGFYSLSFVDGGSPYENKMTTEDPLKYFEYSHEPDYDEYERIQMQKWSRYHTNITTNGLKRSAELKQLLRSGIPTSFRPEMWMRLLYLHLDPSAQNAESLKENYYYYLSQSNGRRPISPMARQVDLDLHRCMPENLHFRLYPTGGTSSSPINPVVFDEDIMQTRHCTASPSSHPQQGDLLLALRNVLLAFSELTFEKIGYCQGIDRVAAVLLLVLPDYMAFTLLYVMLHKLRPDEYYSSNLLDAQVDQRVFQEMLNEYCPELQKKLQSFGIDATLFTLSWFITLFIDGFSWKIFMKILDAFLYEGDKVVFRYAVAIFKYMEPLFLEQKDASGVMALIRNAGKLVLDHVRLTRIAFCELKNFPKRRIAVRRKHYKLQLETELAELEKRRHRSKGIGGMLADALLSISGSNDSDNDD